MFGIFKNQSYFKSVSFSFRNHGLHGGLSHIFGVENGHYSNFELVPQFRIAESLKQGRFINHFHFLPISTKKHPDRVQTALGLQELSTKILSKFTFLRAIEILWKDFFIEAWMILRSQIKEEEVQYVQFQKSNTFVRELSRTSNRLDSEWAYGQTFSLMCVL